MTPEQRYSVAYNLQRQVNDLVEAVAYLLPLAIDGVAITLRDLPTEVLETLDKYKLLTKPKDADQ
jgi:hypothetical protein